MFKKSLPLALAVSMALSSTAATAGNMANAPTTNEFWWPDLINLQPLRQNAVKSNPMGTDFDYAKEFQSLDLAAVKKDIDKTLTDSQDWWPADWGNYGPFFIRMAWHSAGVYRIFDGRGGASGGQQRFEPLNSWPDNANLDKARRLLWPVKQKYGSKISWADLMVLAGNVALENMGFKTFGFAGGREDDWEPELVNWGSEKEWLANNNRYNKGKLASPLAAVQMGLIYVNPEGPGGKPDPLASAKNIRDAFGRMAMNDEETVALIAGGHSFGKAHGAKKASCLGGDPASSGLEAQGFGWKNKCGKGNAEDTMTSGLEGAWSATPVHWGISYLTNLFNFDWKLSTTPAGAHQWVPKNEEQAKIVPDAHIKGKMNTPIMFTTDIALKEDPIYRKIAERFMNNPEEYRLAFAKAWFKLTHRDMGPSARYLGDEVPAEALLWQDPVPKADYKMIGEKDADKLKKQILKSGLSVEELVRTAWASASTYRGTDMRGGANGARIRLSPQKDWPANSPKELDKVLGKLEKIQKDFNKKAGKKQVSMADLIVLGGAAAIEKAAKGAGFKVKVPFTAGRTDATQEMTDIHSFAVLEPKADAFRNYFEKENPFHLSPTEMLVEKSVQLELSVPEMTVLIGGMRALGANADGSKHGIFTNKPGTLSNDFFVNLLDMSTEWTKSDKEGIYEGKDRKSGKLKWTATPVDLAFGSSSELRAVSEVYASNGGEKKFIDDFVKAWTKVMKLDRFDLDQGKM